VSADNFHAFRLELALLTSRAREKLTPRAQDRIRHAVRLRGDPTLAASVLVGTEAEDLGTRILAQLADAASVFSPDEVSTLVEAVDDGLAPGPD
jgi:hypothetical protein